MSKIVFLDVDGTLVDYHNRLPASAADAVARARAAGHRVVLCTGRSRAEVPDFLWALDADGFVGGNGGYVEYDGAVVLHRTLTGDECRAVVAWLHDRGCEFYLETNAGLFASERFVDAAAPVVARYQAAKGAPARPVVEVFHGLALGGDLHRDDVNKLSCILNDPGDHRAAVEAFPTLQRGTWGGRGALALFGDMGPTGITKKAAVTALLDHLDADPADTIALGDATVDLPLFEACAVGVAMGNASDDLKAVADHVTGDVEADGLADAFAWLGLLGR